MATEKVFSLHAETVSETPSNATDPLTAQQVRSCCAASSSDVGKEKSSAISFSRSIRRATLTQASTCPVTRCPSRGSPRRSELSKFTRLPTFHSGIVVRPRVVGATCTTKRDLPWWTCSTSATVRQVPLQAIDAPGEQRARGRSVSIVIRQSL